MPELKPDDFARLVTLSIPEAVTALAFSPDGTLLAVAAADKVHVFRVPTEAKTAASAALPADRK
jgi:hypothetical protein